MLAGHEVSRPQLVYHNGLAPVKSFRGSFPKNFKTVSGQSYGDHPARLTGANGGIDRS